MNFGLKKFFFSKNLCLLQNQPKTSNIENFVVKYILFLKQQPTLFFFLQSSTCDQFWIEKFYQGSAYERMSDRLHLVCFYIAYQVLCFPLFFFLSKKR